MTVEEVVADRLVNAGVAGGRVYQLILPQKPTLPAVRVQLIDEPTDYHLRGDVDVTRARVQVDVYGAVVGVADPYDAVSDVAAAVNTALSGTVFEIGGRSAKSFRESRRVLYEGEELRLIRVSQDFTVHSKTV